MGGKAEAPAPPDYTPQILASQQATASDAHAADLQFELGQRSLDQQDKYAQLSSERADKYYQMSVDSNQWGRDQFNTVWPYAQDYLKQQSTSAEQQRQQSAETYSRYMTSFAPLESKFAEEAQDFGSPARQAKQAADAEATYMTGANAQEDAAKREMMSYGIDPSSGRMAALVAGTAPYMKAAGGAAAGTTARTQTELQGLALQQGAIEVGQKLPPAAIALNAGATSAGGAGLTGANQTIAGGVTSGGSPVQYAALSNPYTTLSGSYGSLGGGLFQTGTSAYGNEASAIGAGTSALNTGFGNQMDVYKAKAAEESALWGGVGKLVGGVGGALLLA